MKKLNILAMESVLGSTPDGKHPRIDAGNPYVEPIGGDEIVFDINDGNIWEGFWIGSTNISKTDSMFHYAIFDPLTNQAMVPGQDYTYHLAGDAVIFTKPLVGPTKFKLQKKYPEQPKIKLVLLPRQQGYHVFPEEVLQNLVADAVGKKHSLRNLIAEPHQYAMYTSCTVISAEVTGLGIEAVVELGW